MLIKIHLNNTEQFMNIIKKRIVSVIKKGERLRSASFDALKAK